MSVYFLVTFFASALNVHPDRVRIHKLLYFVHTQLWAADVQTLDGMPMDRLLKALLDETETIERFQRRLIQYAEQLNKSDTYLQVANLIVEELRKQQSVTDSSAIAPVDRFNLRYAVMQALNPLKAKIILFALWHEYQHPDTPFKAAMVGQFSLDELLRKVMRYYPSLSLLDLGFDQVAPKLKDMERHDITQLADTLKSVLRPYLPADAPFPDRRREEVDWPQDSMCTLLMSPKKSQNAPTF